MMVFIFMHTAEMVLDAVFLALKNHGHD